MKYLLYGLAGLGIGLVLGVIVGSIYTSHLYDVAVQADPVREDDMWGLVNFDNELSGGLWGASAGLVAGLVSAWWMQRLQWQRQRMPAAQSKADLSIRPPPPNLP